MNLITLKTNDAVLWSPSNKSQMFLSLNKVFFVMSPPNPKVSRAFRLLPNYGGEELQLSSVSRWCHVKWPSFEPAPQASGDWWESKLWLHQLLPEGPRACCESEITHSTEKENKDHQRIWWLLQPETILVWNQTGGPPDGNRMIPCAHPDKTPPYPTAPTKGSRLTCCCFFPRSI